MTVAKSAAAKKEPFPAAPEPTTAPAAASKPVLTAAQKKELGDAFLASQATVEKTEAAYDAARAKKSDAVKAIVDAAGNKGPFTIGGKNWVAKVMASTGSYTMVEQATAKDSF